MKVALYARVSTEKQEVEKTIQSQLVEVEAYAQEKGHIIVEKYVDDGFSGTLLARPALDKLRDDARKRLWEAVVIHDPDRLARKYAYQELVIDELQDLGIPVLFVTTPTPKDDSEKLLLGVKGLFAEYERAKFVERTRRGRLHRAKSGHIIGNIPPYGYDCVKKSKINEFAYYTINEDEAKIVRLIFSLLAEKQMTTYGIIMELNRLGIKPRNGKRWAKSTVAKILRNETYTGVTYYNKHQGIPSQTNKNHGETKYHRKKNTSLRLRPRTEWITIRDIPQIIDSELFTKAQVQLNENARFSNRNTKLQYLLKGLPKCGIDHRAYLGVPMHGKPYYRCSGKSKLVAEIVCQSHSINAGILESTVWNAVVELVNNPKIITNQLRKRQEKRLSDTSRMDIDLTVIEKSLQRLDLEEKRLIKAYSSGAIRLEQLREQNQNILNEKERLTIEKNKLLSYKPSKITSLDDVEKYVENFKNGLSRLDFQQRQQFLRLLLNEVIIDGRKLLIRGALPIKSNLYPQPPDERTTGLRQNASGKNTSLNSSNTYFLRSFGTNQNLQHLQP